MRPVFIETMLAVNGSIPLFHLHIERLLWGLYQHSIYDLNNVIVKAFQDAISGIVPTEGTYKVRCLSNVSDTFPLFRAEVEPIHLETSLKKIGIYSLERKLSSSPWNAKTNQRDIYSYASLFAKENGWDDALVLHTDGSIADASIYNLFLLQDAVLYTPPSATMPVKGVMKEWLMRNSVFPIVEKKLYPSDLLQSECLLLTNAVRGIQPARMVVV